MCLDIDAGSHSIDRDVSLTLVTVSGSAIGKAHYRKIPESSIYIIEAIHLQDLTRKTLEVHLSAVDQAKLD